MKDTVEYRIMESGDEAKAFDLVERTFHEFVAPDFSREGIDAFFRNVTLDSMETRLRQNHIIIVATLADCIIGMLDIRNKNHIGLFFVEKQHQAQGIGRRLLDLGVSCCLHSDPKLSQIDVHSAPHSVPIYAKLGFTAKGAEQNDGGIRYTRMIKKLDPQRG